MMLKVFGSKKIFSLIGVFALGVTSVFLFQNCSKPQSADLPSYEDPYLGGDVQWDATFYLLEGEDCDKGTSGTEYHCPQALVQSLKYKGKVVIITSGKKIYSCGLLDANGEKIVRAKSTSATNWIQPGLKLNVYSAPGTTKDNCPESVESVADSRYQKIGEGIYPFN